MNEVILTLNAGSSSIKFGIFERRHDTSVSEQSLASGQIDGIATEGTVPRLRARIGQSERIDTTLDSHSTTPTSHAAALDAVLTWLTSSGRKWMIAGVGHRVVHGGEHFSSPVQLTPSVLDTLTGLSSLAPLHQPHNLAGIAALSAALPNVPQVACFDTAFHRTQPELAQRFALPETLTVQGLRRYGFHGLSYEYIADQLPSVLPSQRAEGRVIVAHLGNGASMCALYQRRSQATTMGFTALDGLIMGTRCGAIDPGVLLHLIEHHGYDVATLTRLLYKESGLLGVSGISADMRTLLDSGEDSARLAVDLFCYHAVREIGSLAAAIGGIDALVFTGGIGEHAIAIRERICRQLAWMGVELNQKANQAASKVISLPHSLTTVCIIPTNEEWMIARHTARLLN